MTAATVAAAGTTMVCNILGPYVFHGQVPNDIQGLIDSTIAAAVTFGAGYLARHVVPTVEHEAEKIVSASAVKAVASEVTKLANIPAATVGVPSSAVAQAPIPPVGG
ncbi:hypothetical protein [Kitasatospora sp. GP82]|uniref:hypothetical protein n=1 Tax=Kitasatospora sp. GP82 TaxID=3035089 RepID=UPI0024740E5F|nr:hypothetical protein [Kitasatospora sp. GP82]